MCTTRDRGYRGQGEGPHTHQLAFPLSLMYLGQCVGYTGHDSYISEPSVPARAPSPLLIHAGWPWALMANAMQTKYSSGSSDLQGAISCGQVSHPCSHWESMKPTHSSGLLRQMLNKQGGLQWSPTVTCGCLWEQIPRPHSSPRIRNLVGWSLGAGILKSHPNRSDGQAGLGLLRATVS